MKSIYFYNWTHNGDIFASKEYIREIIKTFPDVDYRYYHYNKSKLIKDIDIEIKNYEEVELLFPQWDVRPFLETEDILFINTWICSYANNTNWWNYHAKFTHEVYPAISKFLSSEIFTKTVYDYIPEINYDFFDVPLNFQTDYENTMIFSNGPVLSLQSDITDLTPIINGLLEAFPERSLILTEKTNIESSRIFYTDDIIQTANGDINEISYLADKHCKYILGRDSGPFAYMNTKNILNNENKKVVSLGVNELQTFYYNMQLPCNTYYVNENDHVSPLNRIIELWS